MDNQFTQHEINSAHAKASALDWKYDPLLLLYEKPERRGIPRTDWQWIELFWENRKEIKETYRNNIKQAQDDILSIQKSQKDSKLQISDFNKLWVLEIIIEETETQIKRLDSKIRHWQFLIKRISLPPKERERKEKLDIEYAKSIPLEQLYQGQLRSVSGKLLGLCPFHNEDTPSFTIFSDNHYYCFGCNERGDSIDYVQKTQNLNFKEAVQSLMKL